MNKWMRRLLILAVLLGIGYYFLILHSPSPSEEDRYAFNLEEVRKLANAFKGPRAETIAVEKVAEFSFPEAIIMAGEPWQGAPMPVYAFELEFPDQTIIVDTAMASTEGIPEFMVSMYDKAAYQRVSQAMLSASWIVITHEHSDHIGGIIEHPRLNDILPRVRLTQEQVDHQDRMLPLSLPEAEFADYKALQYKKMLAIAPGVVLVKAAGHTPGSQMVYVHLADGREVLLLGDVAWHQQNVDAVRERPLLMTSIIKENRTQVINQFQALHDLMKNTPELHVMPGHDAEVMQALLKKGVFRQGF